MAYSQTQLHQLAHGDKVRVCYRDNSKEKYVSGVIEVVGLIGNNVTNISVSFNNKKTGKSQTISFFHSQIVKVYVEDKLDFDLGI